MIREITKKAIKRSLSFFGYKLERLDSSSSNHQYDNHKNLLDTVYHQEPLPGLKTDDVFLVSYPKSGNTWVRTIVAHILYPHDRIYSLKGLDELVPDISRRSGIDRINSDNEYSNPRVIKTHNSFPFRQERQNSSLYSQVIYIVRHPFDVIRSFHHFNSYRNPKLTMSETVCRVTMGRNQWGSWQDHVLSWKVAEKNSQMIFIRYEDMMEKTTDYIREIAKFLGVTLTEEEAEVIREKSSIKAMSEMEKRESRRSADFQFVRPQEDRRILKQDLTPEIKDFITEQCGYAMSLFDYSTEQ